LLLPGPTLANCVLRQDFGGIAGNRDSQNAGARAAAQIITTQLDSLNGETSW